MNINKPTHIIPFVLMIGFLFYLLSAMLSAIFIVAVPMDRDAVTEFSEVEVDTGSESTRTNLVPVGFKNSFEEVKHYHNMAMLEKNRKFLYAQLLLGGLVGFFFFHVIPKWQGKLDDHLETVGLAIGSFALGAATVLFMPAIFGRVLPPPVNWFPPEFKEISELRERDAIARLRVEAQKLDASAN